MGAYQVGTNPEVDHAIRLRRRINAFLRQGPNDRAEMSETRDALRLLANEVQIQGGAAA